MEEIFNDITSSNINRNNHIILQNIYNSLSLPKYVWVNNPATGMFNPLSNIINFNIRGKTELAIDNDTVIANNIIANNISGSGYYLSNIKWDDIINIESLVTSNTIINVVNFYISSNNLSDQNYINSNSIQDIISCYISSNILNIQNYINSNSIEDITSFYISSNILLKQNYINSNSIQDLLSFLISSNNLYDQKYINSNSIQDITSFYISSNNLLDQKYINSNSISDIVSFLITSNNLSDQNYINSNSIEDLILFYISSNNLSDQRYINSNSIQDIIDFYISSNILLNELYINSNSISDILEFYITSNDIIDQKYINSNSITNIIKFYISCNIIKNQNYINSNSIQDITSFLISSNNLSDQKYINSNSIQDITSFLISSNNLSDQRYINSNSISDISSFYISSNILSKQNYINSNSISDLLSFLISSNNLYDQRYINSNSIEDITSFLISSNLLNKQNYINSNTITDILSFLISSNNLSDQKYINSNTTQNLLLFYISSNILDKQNYINSNSIQDIISFYISSNNLYDQRYINSNSIQDLLSFYISSNNLIDQKYINSNSIQDILEFYISSNILNKQNYINSNSIQDIVSFYISSNNLIDQKNINSNSIQNIISFLISSNLLNKQNYINSNYFTDITSFYITSNNLYDQQYINSNSIEDIYSFIISSNILNKQNYINSNSITDIVSFLITSNNLLDQKYINSNSIEDIISFIISSNNLYDQRYINSNSIEDIISFIISSNILNKQNYINSNSIEDIISFYITSNNLIDQKYINSNSIEDIISFLISSNNLIDQKYINSNSIEDITSFIITSNDLYDQKYINSNSIEDIVSFYISSNNLIDQKYVNSNSITDIISYYITSNNLIDQRYINSNTIIELVEFIITSNNLYDQYYINSNSIADIYNFYVSSNNFVHFLDNFDLTNNETINNILSSNLNYVTETTDFIIDGINNKFIVDNIYNNDLIIKGDLLLNNLYAIGSNSIFTTQIYETEQFIINNNSSKVALIIKQLNSNANLADFYKNNNQLSLLITSNGNIGIDVINPSYKLEVNGNIIASNISGSGSNIIGINWSNLINIPTYYLTSNVLASQKFINSNTTEKVVNFYVSSNNLSSILYNTGFINSNNISVLNSNLDFDTVIQRNVAIDAIRFPTPLIRTSNIINLKYDTTKIILNENNELTLTPNILSSLNNTNTVSFKFNLSQENINYPNLWYFQLKISDYSKTYTIDGNDYNIFNIKSWSDNGLDIINDSLIIVSTQNNGIKTIKTNTLQQGDVIDLGNGLYTTEGWQLDNDIHYLTWYSIKQKCIYNILADQLSDRSDIKIVNYSYLTSNKLLLQNYINQEKINNVFGNYINSNNLYNLLTSNYFNINNQTTDDINNGVNNQFIINNIYNNDLYINGTLTASNIYIIGSNVILDTKIYSLDNLKIDNITNTTALNVNQTGYNADVATFNNNNEPVLIITKEGNVGINTIEPIYNLEVNGIIRTDEIIGSGSNLTNIDWCNLVNIPTNYITSNVLSNVLELYVGSNIINNILLNNQVVPISRLYNLNINYGVDTVINRENAINSVFNQVSYLTSELSNIIINNNLIANNYGLIIDGSYISNNSFKYNNYNSFVYFNCNINTSYSLNTLPLSSILNTTYNNGTATTSVYYLTPNIMPMITDTNNNILYPNVMWYPLCGVNGYFLDISGNYYNSGRTGTYSTNYYVNYTSQPTLGSLSGALTMPIINLNQIQKNNGITISFWANRTSPISQSGDQFFSFASYTTDNRCKQIMTIYFKQWLTGGGIWIAIGTGDVFGNISYSEAGTGFNQTSWINPDAYNNVWIFYTWTIDSAGNSKFYMNGRYCTGINGVDVPILHDDSWSVTYGWPPNTFTSYKTFSIGTYFNGYITDFRIYDFALSQDQVTQLFQRSVMITTNTSNLYTLTNNTYPYVGTPNSWYKFDNDGLTNDAANGNSNILSGTNNPTFAGLSIKGDNSLALNGTNQYLMNSNLNYNLTSNSFTVTSWIYPKNDTNMCLFSFGSNVTQIYNKINFGIYSSNYYLDFNDNKTLSIVSATNDINKWVHIAITFNLNTNTRLMYLNGIIVGTNYNVIGVPTILPLLTIGAYNNSIYWYGNIDDLRIYNGVVLNLAQILEIYTGRITYSHYTNNGPLYINNLTGNIGVGSVTPTASFEVTGNIFASNLIGSSSNITLMNWNNVMNIPSTILNANSIVTSNYFAAQQYLNVANTNATYVTSNVLSWQYYLNSNVTSNIIYNYSNSVINTYKYVHSNILQSLLINNSTIKDILSTDYDLLINSRLIGNNIFNITNNNTYLYYNNSPLNSIILKDTSLNYIINYNNGKAIITYTSNNVINSNYPLIFNSINNSYINPILWYQFNDINNIGYDSSGNYNTYINNNTVITNTQKYNNSLNAAYFDGNSKNIFIQILPNVPYPFSKGFTFSLWYYNTSAIANTPQTIFNFDYSNTPIGGAWTDYWKLLFHLSDSGSANNIRIYYSTSNLNPIISPVNISETLNIPNIWNHFAVTITTTNLLKVYYNGVNFYTYNGSVSDLSIIKEQFMWLRLGGRERTDCGYFKGYMDDVRIYDIALSSDEIFKLSETKSVYSYIISSNINYISSNNNFSDIYNNNNIINPLAWYKFDNNIGMLIDSSGNNYNLTIPRITPTLSTNCIKGSTSALFVKNYANIDNETLMQYFLVNGINIAYMNFSISMWLYNASIISYGNWCISAGNVTGIYNTMQIGMNTSYKWYFGFFGDDLATPLTYQSDLNTWVYITCTYDYYSKKRCIYRNGILLATDNPANNLNSTNVLYVGYYKIASVCWDGYMDDVRIYNICLTQSQISQLYNNYNINPNNAYANLYNNNINNTIINPNLWYKFNNEGLTYDSSGNNNILNLHNNPTYSDISLKGDNSLKLNGNNQYLAGNYNFNITSNNYSICTWLYNSYNSNVNIITLGLNNSSNINIGIDNYYYIRHNSNNILNSSLYTTNILNTWNHIVFTYDNTTNLYSLYINGNIINTNNYNIKPPFESYLTIGNYNNSNYYNGYLNDLRIYNITLTSSQINELYTGRITTYNYVNNNGPLFINSLTNNIGINNNNPIYPLQVFGTTSANNYYGVGSNISLINWNNINNLPNIIINANNNITSNILNEQNYINSNSVQDVLSFYISSNNLSDQQLINSNSIQDLMSFYISSNILSEQQLINSNSIQDIISFYITSNNLYDQKYINSNSISDIISFYISSNNLYDQQLINSNSIQDIISFYTSSNNLYDQNYINSNSIQDITLFYISSNNLSEQQLINSNSIQDLLGFYISSNNLYDQQLINSNSIQDIISFYITSNNLSEQQLINSNSIQDIISFYITSNNLSDQQYINLNSISDITSFYISSNNLSDQKYINSNSIQDLISFYISSNNLSEQQLINSNNIQDILEYYISSNNLSEQQLINSNSITDIISYYITSNNLLEQNYINSNSFEDIITFYISSNNLSEQQYINSNSIENIFKFNISSNILYYQNYINSNSIQDILGYYISSNNLIDQKYINSNLLENILNIYISSNTLNNQKYISSNSFENILGYYISSNNLSDQQYINSNSIQNTIGYYISSNNLSDQQYISSNNIQDIDLYYISSNDMTKNLDNYVSSNSTVIYNTLQTLLIGIVNANSNILYLNNLLLLKNILP